MKELIKMREINWLDRRTWLEDLHLQPGQLVRVKGLAGVYRYEREKSKATSGEVLWTHVLCAEGRAK